MIDPFARDAAGQRVTDIVAITGATGFIGRALVGDYLARTDSTVRVLARDARVPIARWADAVDVVEGSLEDEAAVARLTAGASAVIHLAYLRGGVEANLSAARVLAEAAKRSGVRRVVHCSTAVVVGPSARGTIDERVPDQPRGEYQTAKLAIEHQLIRGLRPGTDLAILRPTEVIGAGGAGLRDMIRRLSIARAPRRTANVLRHMMFAARCFNYVCIRNVVAGLRLLAEAPNVGAGGVYYLSDDEDPGNNYAAVEARILEVLGRSRIVGPTIPRGMLSLAYRMFPNHAPPNRVYSTAKIRGMGYRKVTSLAETIDEVVAFEQERAR